MYVCLVLGFLFLVFFLYKKIILYCFDTYFFHLTIFCGHLSNIFRSVYSFNQSKLCTYMSLSLFIYTSAPCFFRLIVCVEVIHIRMQHFILFSS